MVVILFGLVSCVSYAPSRPVSPAQLNVATESKEVSDTSYQLGVERSAYVGEPLARVKKYQATQTQSDRFVTTAPVTLDPTPGEPKTYPAGTKLIAAGSVPYEGREYIAVKFEDGVPYGWYHAMINPDGSFSGYFYAQLNRIVLANGKAAEFSPATFTLARERSENVSTSGAYVNFELVYSGITNDSINLLYREYTADDMARPAFSQNLVYEKSAKTIRFRNLVIDLVSASNEALTYTVTSD
ncbi:hypothetical protein C7S18_12260 [Ahniella affigens]|uniref:Uncharacterized protein n=2 Tax=Ahniella affigens TaxID=2021234 RepID=A0A2P1PSU2_9GAMM|nr:hypothetical protein C7S18_12260 [Ahniella affigens]